MTKDELLERKAVIEKQFSEYDTEMKRLQGEHRLITDLLNGLEGVDAPTVKSKRIRKVDNAPNNE